MSLILRGEIIETLDFEINNKNLLRFTLPTIISMVLAGIYGMIDGLFVSNLLGVDSLSAINIVFPVIMLVMAFGTMIGTGGNALIGKMIGENKLKEARGTMSMLFILVFIISTILSIVGFIFKDNLIYMLGADEALFTLCNDYLIPMLFLIPVAMLGMLVQNFLITDGKPKMAMYIFIAGGVLNIVLDYLLIAIIPLGLTGASIATVTGYSFPAIIGIIYFLVHRNGTLYLSKPILNIKDIIKSITNGASEFVTAVSGSIVTIIMNIILMNLGGSDAVAATSIIYYVFFIILSMFMGYAFGIAPLISFNYGKNDFSNIDKIISLSLKFIGKISVLSFFASMIFANFFVSIFVEANTSVYSLAVSGFRIFAFSFLFIGFNIFASSFFTAFGNGKVSATLSFLRTLVFITILLLTLPNIFGVMGVYLATPVAEIFSILVSLYYFLKMSSNYGYKTK